mmetsp:Transcript_34775/g.58875  ORF Transcript_34775/g.58875 Transcript_34775/m.58875 type:complete len:342 (-) Transcript_34775:267-1292(-)
MSSDRKAERKQVFILKEGSPDLKEIDWELFDAKLPCDRSEASQKTRAKLFAVFDPNGNGLISLAEIEKGLMEVLGYGVDVKRVVAKSVARAHRGAKAAIHRDNSKAADDYVEKREFRVFIEFFRFDLHLLKLFLDLDTSDDLRLSKEEFIEAVPVIQKKLKLKALENPEEAWNEMDADHAGMALYEEFANWMMDKKAWDPSTQLQMIQRNVKNTYGARVPRLSLGKVNALTPSHASSKSARSPIVSKSARRNSNTPSSAGALSKQRAVRSPPTMYSAQHHRRGSSSSRNALPPSKIETLLKQMEERLVKRMDERISAAVGKIMERLDSIAQQQRNPNDDGQ